MSKTTKQPLEGTWQTRLPTDVDRDLESLLDELRYLRSRPELTRAELLRELVEHALPPFRETVLDPKWEEQQHRERGRERQRIFEERGRECALQRARVSVRFLGFAHTPTYSCDEEQNWKADEVRSVLDTLWVRLQRDFPEHFELE